MKVRSLLVISAFVFLSITFLLAGVHFVGRKPHPRDPFFNFDPYQVEGAAVGAILIPNIVSDNGDGPYAEICSGSLVDYDHDGNGLFLTARHCVWDADNNVFRQDEFVSFRANLKGPYYQTEVAEIAPKDDLAILRVINAQSATNPIIPEVLESEDALSVGDAVENVSFPLDMGKLEFHGTFVDSVFPHFSRMLQDYPEWKNTFPVDITIGHGSSGSPLFDSKTHKLIGVMVGTSGEGRLTFVEPESRVYSMLKNPDKNSLETWNSAHPQKQNNPDPDESSDPISSARRRITPLRTIPRSVTE